MRGQKTASKRWRSVLNVTVVPANATPCSRQMAPRPGVTWVRLTGQFAGTENRSPANLTDCHDDGTTGEDADASTTERGERVRVFRTCLARGPTPATSISRDGTM
jgi:hypothetical protein